MVKDVPGERDTPTCQPNIEALTVLIVDDEAPNRLLCSRFLEGEYNVVACACGTEALDELDRADVLLTDLDMPTMSGLALIERVRLLRPDLPTVMMTGTPVGDSRRVRATSLGVPVLSKPFSRADLLDCLQRHLEPLPGARAL